VRVRGNRQL